MRKTSRVRGLLSTLAPRVFLLILSILVASLYIPVTHAYAGSNVLDGLGADEDVFNNMMTGTW